MDDKDIKKILGDIPPIKDNRSKEAILARLEKDERLQKVEPMPPKRKKSVKWIPAFVAIASLFILSFLLPAMLSGNNQQADDALHSASERAISQDMDESEMESFSSNDPKSDGIVESQSNILFFEELGDARIFQIGLVSNANVIPVTFLIPAEQILVDFPEGEPNTVQLYNKYAADIPEEALGFDVYHPYKGEITINNDVVVHKLPDNHGYDEVPVAIDVYKNSVKTTFIDYPEFQPADIDGEQAQFSQVGLMDSIELSKEGHFGSYYKYVIPTGQVFLVPQGEVSDYETVDQALLGMQEMKKNLVNSVVPRQLKYDVDVENGVAIIRFSELLDLSKMKDEDVMAMIEGFILTADCYQHVVQFENLLQKNWGKYDLTSPLPKPVAVNPIEFIFD